MTISQASPAQMPSTNPVLDFLIDLRTTAWRTAGARYNAARRLRRRESFSTVSLALFSTSSIAVTFIQRIYSPQAGTPLDNYLTTLLASLGVFLLTISLLEWGAAYGAKAEALHRNAEELTAYQFKLKQVLAESIATGIVDSAKIDQLRVEYEGIKGRCGYNHDPRDDLLFRAARRLAPEFLDSEDAPVIGAKRALLIKMGWHLSTVWYFALFWLVIFGAFAYAWHVPK